MSDIAAIDRVPSLAPVNRSCVVRIELSPTRRRQLGALARAADISADALACRLLCDVLAQAEVDQSVVVLAVHGPEPVKRALKTSRRVRRPAPIPQSTKEPVEANGVHVDFRRSVVRFRGHEVAVSSRQANAVVVLARAMPNIVARNQICDQAWPHLAPTSAENTLNILREPLQQRLERIGLTIHVARKLGLALRVAESAT